MNIDEIKPNSYGAYVLTAPIGQGCARVNLGQKSHDGKTPRVSSLCLYNASGVDDGAFYPAESFGVYGLDNITALRDLLNDAIKLAHKDIHPEPVADAILQTQVFKI